MRCHLFRLGEEFGKGPVLNIVDIATERLRQEDLVGMFGAIVEDVVGDDFPLFLLG